MTTHTATATAAMMAVNPPWSMIAEMADGPPPPPPASGFTVTEISLDMLYSPSETTKVMV